MNSNLPTPGPRTPSHSGLFIIPLIFALFIFVNPAIAQDDTLNISDTTVSMMMPTIAPPSMVTVEDTPDDAGGSITIRWTKSAEDSLISSYRIQRAVGVNGKPGKFEEIGDVTIGAEVLQDGNVKDGVDYFYKVISVAKLKDSTGAETEVSAASEVAGPVQSSPQWFDTRRINSFIGVILLSFFIIYFIMQAKAGKKLFIRKIAGMEAVDEAVGRATEMGRKIFYVPGIGDMDNMMTIAAMTIMGRVAELAAQYETYLDVPVCRSMVMVTAREIVKEAHSKAGRPDSYKDDQVHYLTDDQFGYAAAVDGMFVREKPATVFFMGQFYAESLILAETGNSIGAIQIAGTAMPSQLPFFVAACDYTLIGEELFAASAYLSGEPKLLGSLKGQDIGKGVILVALLVGLVLETFGIYQLSKFFTVLGN